MKKFILFAIAGGTSALSNFLIYFILLKVFHMSYMASSVIAFILSIFVGFYMQKFVTFKDSSKSSWKKQAITFFLISFGNLFINVVLMVFFVEKLHIDKLFSKILTLGILACWNFFVYKNFVFNNKKVPQN